MPVEEGTGRIVDDCRYLAGVGLAGQPNQCRERAEVGDVGEVKMGGKAIDQAGRLAAICMKAPRPRLSSPSQSERSEEDGRL